MTGDGAKLVPLVANAISKSGHKFATIFDGTKRHTAYSTYEKIRKLKGHMFAVFDDVFDSSLTHGIGR